MVSCSCMGKDVRHQGLQLQEGQARALLQRRRPHPRLRLRLRPHPHPRPGPHPRRRPHRRQRRHPRRRPHPRQGATHATHVSASAESESLSTSYVSFDGTMVPLAWLLQFPSFQSRVCKVRYCSPLAPEICPDGLGRGGSGGFSRRLFVRLFVRCEARTATNVNADRLAQLSSPRGRR